MQRESSKSPLLLVLALMALAGCMPPPGTGEPPPSTTTEIQFNVTVPPETPADATLILVGPHQALRGFEGKGLELIYQGGEEFSVKVQVPKEQSFTYQLQLFRGTEKQVALDAAGAVLGELSFSTGTEPEKKVEATVSRWGPETGAPTEPQLTFVVQVPEETPQEASIWLSGNHALLGNWNGAGVQLHKALGSRYAATLSFPAGTALEFKATRGSWDTVEKGPSGEEVGNHTHTTAGGFERLTVTVATWADISGVPVEPVLTGNIKYHRGVTSQFVGTRDVIVWLPPDYETNTTRTYPVLYMHDGQNLMDATTAFAGEWGVDETAQQLVEDGEIMPLIIVGIYNTAERISDYTPVADTNPDPEENLGGGNAAAYGRFLVDELKPFIDSTYRTVPDSPYTGLAGSSLGGLVSMYLGMEYPQYFKRLGVISPSVFWANKDIVTRVNDLTGKLALHIWLDIGTAEGNSSQETVEDTQALRDALVAKGWVLGDDLKYTEVPDGQHNEAAWAARFGDVLRELYPPR